MRRDHPLRAIRVIVNEALSALGARLRLADDHVGQACGTISSSGSSLSQPVGAREEPVAIERIEQRHRLPSERVDDVPVVDYLVVLAGRGGTPARQRREVVPPTKTSGRSSIEAKAQAMTDQARGHGVEHLARPEASRGGDAHAEFLIVGGAPVGQFPKLGALGIDALGIAGIAAATISSTKRR